MFHDRNSNTVNPRISPLGAYLFLIFLEGLIRGGFIRGGVYTRGGLYEGGGGAYRINVDIKKNYDLIYFSRNFFLNI